MLPAAIKSVAAPPRRAAVPSATEWGADFEVLTEALRLHHESRLDEALALYLWLEARHGDSANLKFNIGVCYQQRRHLSMAVKAFRGAIELNSELIIAHESLGEVLRDQGRLPEAEASFRRVLEIDVVNLGALRLLSSVLKAQGRYDDAVEVIKRALSLKPDLVPALVLLGTLSYEKGEIEAAVGIFRQALLLDSEQAQAHFNLSQCLLLQGKFSEGWREHEWRCGTEALSALERGFNVPQWHGEPLSGKTILLHAEQGLGDTIQFVRYAPLLKAKGARVIVECQTLLLRLLDGMLGVDLFVAKGQPLPAFDYHVPLLGLPHCFGTELATIPAPQTYLRPPKIGQLDLNMLGVSAKRPRIGLCWAGNPEHSNDANRSVRLALFESLVRAYKDKFVFVSLQIGPRSAERSSYLWADCMFDAAPHVTDFADSAEIMSQLDLVIGVDTSVIHLAGAMGCPVWVLLPFVPDSRWLMQRIDSPWYPSMRLFRQSAIDNWDSVFTEMGVAIAQWMQEYEVVLT